MTRRRNLQSPWRGIGHREQASRTEPAVSAEIAVHSLSIAIESGWEVIGSVWIATESDSTNPFQAQPPAARRS
jgi:hypothetical protein